MSPMMIELRRRSKKISHMENVKFTFDLLNVTFIAVIGIAAVYAVMYFSAGMDAIVAGLL